MKKRMLAMLLCMAIALSLLPTGTFAAGTSEWIEVDGIVGGKIEFNESTGVIGGCEETVTSADIPSSINGVSVTLIGYKAFYDCDNLTKVTIPDSVTSIGEYAFQSCSSLSSVSIGNGVTSIGEYAFQSCSSLSSVSIPDSVTSIGDYAFAYCSSLSSVSIGNGVMSIGEYAFQSCSSLSSVSIPDSVTSIGDYAFAYCSSLSSVSIPGSVTSIGYKAFFDCTSLESIFVAQTNSCYCSDGDGALFDKSKSKLIQYPVGHSRTTYSIPDSVTSIGNYAFAFCNNLTSVTIPDGVTSIGDGAFYECFFLTSITIPSSVTSIGSTAFYECSNLSNVTIPSSVTSIGDGAFCFCISLTSVIIPASVTSIGDNAFAYCKSLTSVTILDGVTRIASGTFDACVNLTSIIIPASVTSIGDNAFAYCKSLTSVTIPDNVTYIGESAFEDCESLTSVTIPVSVTRIDEFAFLNSRVEDVYYAGTEGAWNSISIGTGNWGLTVATIHFNSTGPEDEGEDKDEEFTTRTEYHQLKGHDAFTNTVIFEDGISYKWAHEDDWADIMALVGKWVRCTIEYSEQSGDILIAVEKVDAFQFGRDNLSFTNTHKDFFNTSECIVWEKEDAEANGKSNALPGFAKNWMKDIGGVNTGYQISDEAFGRLISGMSNTVVHRIYTEKNSLWGGSCYGMARVMAVRYLDPERLPLSEIDSSLNNMNSTFDLQAPKDSEDTENLINYYHLSQLLPVNINLKDTRGNEIAMDYTKSLASLVSAIKAGISVPVSISHCELNESGQSVISYSHSVLLLDILGVNENYYEVKVCDPTETKYTTMRIYRQPGIEPKAFKIEYTPSDTYHYNVLRCYYSSLEEMDWRNYFGLDDNAGWLTDYNQNILVVRLDSSVSFTSDNVTLQYKDGVILNRENISSPYIIPNTMVDGTDASEAEFLFEKSSKDSVSSLSVSSETGYVDTTLILDGWSATIRSENAISVQANSQNQSVAIQSEDAGMISLLLTQNETAEDWPWYGIAVDVDDATELIVTPTDAGIQISSDNLDGAAVAGQSNDNIDSLTLNTKSKTVLLVNKTPSDSGSNYIGIIAEDVTVTFDPNGGTVTPVSAVTGEDGTLASLPVPTRDGYIFNGWYSAPSGGNKITTSTVFATNTTVYAQWSKDTSGSSSSGSGSSTANTYTISTSATENGSVSVSPKSASEGSTVTITAAPDTGYRLDKLTVTDKHGNEVSLIDNGNGTYTFTMPASQVSISASFIALEVPAPALPFTDVTTSDWFYDAVAYAYDNGLMTGTSATTFSPKATTTRGMIVTILHRLEGCPAAAASGFADVKSGAWYQEAVDWAAANGIVNGTSATTFAPTSPITREQMAAILYRYAAYKGYDVSQLANLSRFSDSSAVSAYAADALAWANAAGLITGVTDISLSPQGSAVRAQVATILMRFCENIAQ